MRVIKAILAAATLLAGFTFNAQAADPIEGKDYTVISPALQNDSPGKIEISEFFWYGCPHCFHFEEPLAAWAKTAPKDVVLRFIPAPLNPTWTPGARLYYALDALGAETRLRHDLFDAIHNQHFVVMAVKQALIARDWCVTNTSSRLNARCVRPVVDVRFAGRIGFWVAELGDVPTALELKHH